MNPNVQAAIKVFKESLEAEGLEVRTRETARGFTVFASPPRESTVVTDADLRRLRLALKDVRRRAPVVSGRDGVQRVTLTDVATELDLTPRRVGVIARWAGLHLIVSAARTFVLIDAQWETFVGVVPRRTPVR